MQACGLDLESHPELRTTDFYTSHEALLLGYEQALTRVDSTDRATGTRPPATWSGSATAPASPTTPMSNSAAASRIRSASRCGPSQKPDELLRLIDMLNPDNEPGRLTLIVPLRRRQGRRACCRALMRAVKTRRPDRWCGRAIRCTATPSRSATGYKTRPFDLILKEVRAFFAGARRRRHARRRRASRDDRPERHRMHRRRARDHRRGPQRPLSHASAIRGSTPSRRSSSPSCWPTCSRPSARTNRSRCLRSQDCAGCRRRTDRGRRTITAETHQTKRWKANIPFLSFVLRPPPIYEPFSLMRPRLLAEPPAV